MKFAVIALIAMSMSGCGENSRIQEAIRSKLIDPDSAKFGTVTIVNKNRACVTINSKNSLGGYTGNQEAWLQKSQDKWEVTLFEQWLGHDQCIKSMSKL